MQLPRNFLSPFVAAPGTQNGFRRQRTCKALASSAAYFDSLTTPGAVPVPFEHGLGVQAVAALTTTRTFSPKPIFDTLISSRPSLTLAYTPSGSISDGRSNMRKICLERRSE